MAASYPSSVKTWTPVVDTVDTIDAAHVNDLYEEVIAVETDLIENAVAIPTSGLVCWLDGDDFTNDPQTTTLEDRSTANNDATAYNFAYTNASGSDDAGGIVFDGSNDYLRISQPSDDDFSLIVKFKTSSTGGTSNYYYNSLSLIGAEIGGFVYDFGMGIGAGNVVIGIGKNANPDLVGTSAYKYNDGTWHVAAMIRSKALGIASLLVDGQLVAQILTSTASLSSSDYLFIGSNSASGGFFSGTIRSVLVYNRAINRTELDEIMDYYA